MGVTNFESMQQSMQQTAENTFRTVNIMFTIVPIIFIGVFLAVLVVIIRSVISHGRTSKRIYDMASTRVQQAQTVSPGPQARPKQIVNRTNDMLPLVCEDFPAFSWEEMRSKTKNAIRAVLLARTTANPSLLPEESSEELKKQLSLELADDKAGGDVPKYGDIEIGNAEISAYARRNGFCVVSIQAQVRCRKWTERDGRVISGSRDRTADTVFVAELILFKDPARASECGYDLTCPGCGGRISNLKATSCEYCGRPLLAVNAWRLGEIREL